jgi:predicted DNA-binding transcriptional regulator AlpA
MSTDNLTLLLLPDLIVRRIANNRMHVYRMMARKHDPFPQPIVLAEGKPIVGTTRVTGRRVAWRASDVEAWLSRRTQPSRGSAA